MSQPGVQAEVIHKKVCLLGAFAVGKTSLVRRYVESIFDEKYQTTLGVKVDKKTLRVEGSVMTLVLWDLAGKDQFASIRPSHLRGASGFILVVDGTRRGTLDTAVELRRQVVTHVGAAPYVVALNKNDLGEDWALDSEALRGAFPEQACMLSTSAKTGQGVEELFAALAHQMRRGNHDGSVGRG